MAKRRRLDAGVVLFAPGLLGSILGYLTTYDWLINVKSVCSAWREAKPILYSLELSSCWHPTLAPTLAWTTTLTWWEKSACLNQLQCLDMTATADTLQDDLERLSTSKVFSSLIKLKLFILYTDPNSTMYTRSPPLDLPSCPRLETLEIEDQRGYPENFLDLTPIATSANLSVKALALNYSRLRTPPNLSSFGNLQRLDCDGTHLAFREVQLIAQTLIQLTWLDMPSFTVPVQTCWLGSKLDRLKTLYFPASVDGCGEDLEPIWNDIVSTASSTLEVVSLRENDHGTGIYSSLEQCSQLRELFWAMDDEHDESQSVWREPTDPNAFQKLSSLEISDPYMTQSDLVTAFSNAKDLESLTFNSDSFQRRKFKTVFAKLKL
jgi:hypothetical protein